MLVCHSYGCLENLSKHVLLNSDLYSPPSKEGIGADMVGYLLVAFVVMLVIFFGTRRLRRFFTFFPGVLEDHSFLLNYRSLSNTPIAGVSAVHTSSSHPLVLTRYLVSNAIGDWSLTRATLHEYSKK